jgi:hypothetical protein
MQPNDKRVQGQKESIGLPGYEACRGGEYYISATASLIVSMTSIADWF